MTEKTKSYVVMYQEFEVLLSKFLAERRKSSGGWAEVTQADFYQLARLVDKLIALKFMADPDGDYPIQFQFVDRNKGHFLLPENFVPYNYENDPERWLREMSLSVNIISTQINHIPKALEEKAKRK